MQYTIFGFGVTLCKSKYKPDELAPNDSGVVGTFDTEVAAKVNISHLQPNLMSQETFRRRVVTAPIGVLTGYQYIRYGDDILLITTEHSGNKVYDKVVAMVCNYVIKFQDDKLRTVCKPAYLETAAQYNQGTQGRNAIITGFDKLRVYLPYDEQTAYLRRDVRLFIDNNPNTNSVYSIAATDNVLNSGGMSRNGVLSLMLQESQYNQTTDRADLGLCDYIAPSDVSYAVGAIKGEPRLYVGVWQKYTSIVKVNHWRVIADFDVLTRATLEDIEIKVDDINQIGRTLKLIGGSADNDDYNLDIEVVGV
jgi:hypothetical protein